MKEYQLAVFIQHNEKKEIKAIRAINNSEYLSYIEAKSYISNFNKTQDLITAIHINNEKYHALEHKVRNVFQQNGIIEPNLSSTFVMDLNRLLLNYLSSIFAFLDHTRERLSKDPNEMKLKVFDAARKKYYDNYFSYRFIYSLRNYTQHQTNPIKSLPTEKFIDNNKIIRRITIGVERDSLIVSKKFKNNLNEELESLPEYIDLLPYIFEMTENLKKLNISIIEQELSELHSSYKVINELIKEIPSNIKKGIPCIFCGTEVIKPKGKFTLNIFPLDDMHLLKNAFLL